MSYIGIHPNAYWVIKMEMTDPDYFRSYNEIYNDRDKQTDLVWWNGEYQEPTHLWNTLIVSNLQARAARAVPHDMRYQLPPMFYQALNDEFDLFRSLIYAKFPMTTESDGVAMNVALDILTHVESFDDEGYTSLSHKLKLTVDMIYLRYKQLDLTLYPLSPYNPDISSDSDYDIDDESWEYIMIFLDEEM